MQITEQEKREAVGIELADIVYRQHMILRCNEALHFTEADAVTDDFRHLALEDEKIFRLIETALGSFGLRMEPKSGTLTMTEALCEVIEDASSLPLEKLSAYVLLKQSQVLGCHLVHKSGQLSKPDIKTALAPFEGIHASLSRQLTDLNSHLEQTGVEWITGESPSSGLLGRIRDAAGAAIGSVRGKVAKPGDEMNILELLKLDHRKVEMLFKEIKATSDRQDAYGLFNQLKADLTAHSEAEEETVYRPFLKYIDMKAQLDDAWREHVKIRAMLDELTHNRHDRKLFLLQLNHLQKLVDHHVKEEEGQVFDHIRRHAEESELIRLSQDFLAAKQFVQEALSANGINSPVSGMVRPPRPRSDHTPPSASV